MTKEGFGSITVNDEAIKVIDKIRRRDPHEPSRAKVVEAAVKAWAVAQGIPA